MEWSNWALQYRYIYTRKAVNRITLRWVTFLQDQSKSNKKNESREFRRFTTYAGCNVGSYCFHICGFIVILYCTLLHVAQFIRGNTKIQIYLVLCGDSSVTRLAIIFEIITWLLYRIVSWFLNWNSSFSLHMILIWVYFIVFNILLCSYGHLHFGLAYIRQVIRGVFIGRKSKLILILVLIRFHFQNIQENTRN